MGRERERAEHEGAGLGAPERPAKATERGRPREAAAARLTIKLMFLRVSTPHGGGLMAEKGLAERLHLPNGDAARAAAEVAFDGVVAESVLAGFAPSEL